MIEEYRGVKISIQPGNLRTNERGSFTLTWPGHGDEKVPSEYKQQEYILGQAKEFVDAWLTDGFIQLDEKGNNDGKG